jgi:Family of unknown function (DUF5675)
MRLLLGREPSTGGATVGRLTVEGQGDELLAWTLEDQVRELEGVPVEAWKVPGATAIPRGDYRVVVTFSPKFGRPMPLLLGVPGFSDIRIHWGNDADDTEGCLLVGLERQGPRILQSRAAFLQRVFPAIESSLLEGDEVRIRVA